MNFRILKIMNIFIIEIHTSIMINAILNALKILCKLNIIAESNRNTLIR